MSEATTETPTTEIRHRYTDEVLHTVEGETLVDADLRYADLRYANLWDADLPSGIVTLRVLSYRAEIDLQSDEPRITYGCESGTLSWWREHLADLCEKHEPDRADEYERALGAVLDMAETLAEGEDDE